MRFEHKPVLLTETIDSLRVKPDGVYVDGTLGGGGHALELLKRLGPEGRLIGIDQDGDAIAAAAERLKAAGRLVRFNREGSFVERSAEGMEPEKERHLAKPDKDRDAIVTAMEQQKSERQYSDEARRSRCSSAVPRIDIIRSNFEALPQVLDALGIGRVDGIYLDLGVSSFQFDNAERGFSYREDAPLDMRMDRRQELTAADVVGTYGEDELTRVIRDYGEEKFARPIARQIVRRRQQSPILTTGRLTEIIREAVPPKARAAGHHPARRTFQALRIEVNRELEVLEHSIDAMIGRLAPGGRLAVITFHSLEDRIVKDRFQENENPCICPPDFPVCVCGRKSKGKVITRKPVVPTAEEIEENNRCRSAKLRVFEAF